MVLKIIEWLERNYVLSWIITILIAIFIFFISSLNFGSGSGGSGFNALIYHVGIFFIFSIFLMISLVRGKHYELFLIAFLFAFFYGVSDELHQFFVPGRASSFYDVFLNSLGIFFAFLIYISSFKFRKSKTNKRKRLSLGKTI